MILLRTLLLRIKKSKYSKILFRLYIVWCVVADVTLLSGIIWGLIYFGDLMELLLLPVIIYFVGGIIYYAITGTATDW